MKWETISKNQTKIKFEGETFTILCEVDTDGEIALSIDGEYICDLTKLPTREELIDYVDQYKTLNEMTNVSFLRRAL